MARRKKASKSEDFQYWLSYSDMMAGLLLVFALIISFTIMQAKKQYEIKEEQLIEQQSIAEEQQEIAKEQKKVLENQQKELAEQQLIMEEQQEKIDKILGVKSELVEALRDEFEGTDLKVSVDPQTGAITFDSSVLFDYNKYDIKQTGRNFLQAFLPKYFDVLMKPEFAEYIAEIIIEGHTDTEGGYIYNLDLSQKRALSVASFCLEEGNGVVAEDSLEELRKIVTANGRSYSNPIMNEDGTVNKDASRRVEFKFRLKDEDMIEEMKNILNKD